MIVLILVSLALGVTLALNIVLQFFKPKVVAAADAFLTDHVEIGSIFYVFPNSIIVKNVRVTEAGGKASRQFSIPVVIAQFSLAQLLRKHELAINSIGFRHPQIHYDYFSDFLRRDGKKILDFLLSLPRIDVRFGVKEAHVEFSENPQKPESRVLNFLFRLKGDTVLVNGNLRRDKYAPNADKGGLPERVAKGIPLGFEFKGILIDNGFLIDNLAFSRPNLYLKLWGSVQDKQLQLNGFSFLDTYSLDEYQTARPGIFNQARTYLSKLGKESSGIRIDEQDIYVIDMNCLADLSLQEAHIQHFTFNFNGIPVSLTGDLSFKEPWSTQLEVVLFPSRARNLPTRNMQLVNVHLQGALHGKIFKSDSQVQIDFEQTPGSAMPLENIDSSLKGLSLSFDQYARSIMQLEQGDVAVKISGKTHRLHIKDLDLSLSVLDKKLKVFDIGAPFYDGELKGNIWLTAEEGARRVQASVNFNDADAGQLDDLLVDFARVEGTLSGKLTLDDKPKVHLDGEFKVVNGELTKFEFFDWLAETFHVPSLHKIRFKELSSTFFADLNNLNFPHILLNSDDINVEGYFNIDKDNLVSSQLSLAFSKKLLAESPKFRPILKIFGDDIPAVVFNFQLSGPQDSMSFQWLPSEHKRMIQERIPDFIERIIQRNIDRMIEGPEERGEGTVKPSRP